MDKKGFTLTPQQRAKLAELGVVLCYLHGSVAKGIARDDSDIDIAVLFDRMPDDVIGATGALIQALAGLAQGRELDIAILNEASPLLKQIVASTGKLLYARSTEDELRFQIRAMHEYEDSRHIVRLGQEIAMKRAGL